MVIVGAPSEAARALASALAEAGVPETDGFVDGLYFATNPTPAGEYRMPADLRRTACVMSPEGLRRSDPAYLDRVVLVADHWSRSDPDHWLTVVHDLLVDASTRGLPLWTLGTAEPVWAGFAPWAAGGGVPLSKVPSLLPRPRVGGSNHPLCDPLYGALATRGNIADAVAQALGDHVESLRSRRDPTPGAARTPSDTSTLPAGTTPAPALPSVPKEET